MILIQHKAEARQAMIDGAIAQQEAAEDIAEIKKYAVEIIDNQKHLIDNQRELIDVQKESIEQLKSVNESQKLQLQRIHEILVSIENGTAVDEQMLMDIQELLSKQPGWKDFIADKGTDVAIGGILAALPQILKMMGVMI